MSAGAAAAATAALHPQRAAAHAEGPVRRGRVASYAPNARTYTGLLAALAKQQHWREAVGALSSMLSDGIEPDTMCFNAALGAYRRGNQWKQALDSTQRAPLAAPSVVSYSAALSACECSRQWEEALGLCAKLQHGSLEADVVLLSGAISACEKGAQWFHALGLLEAMPQQGISTNAVSHNAAQAACEKPRRWLECLGVLAAMQRRSLQPDVITLSTAARTCERGGLWQLAAAMIAAMHGRSLRANAISYSTLIGPGEQGRLWERSLGVLTVMEQAGLDIGAVTHSSAVAVCEEAERWEQALRALAMMPSLAVRPNVISYSSALSACARVRQWQLASEVLLTSGHCSLEADVISCNAAVSASGGPEGHRWAAAWNLMAAAVRHGIECNTVTFSAAGGACAEAGEWVVSLRTLEAMTNAPVETDTIAYCGGMRACETHELWAASMQLIASMLDAQVADRTVQTYTHGIQAGGPADCQKHVVLVALLQHMVNDPSPFTYVDAHGGGGVYDLTDPVVARFKDGYLQLAQAFGTGDGHWLPPAVAAYLAAEERLREAAMEPGPPRYFGSPVLAREWLRPQDAAIVFETSTGVHSQLQQGLLALGRGAAPCEVVHEDSYRWLYQLPSEPRFARRGLVLLDPPYDSVSSANTWNLFVLAHLRRVWPQCCVALWYPRKDADQVASLHRLVRNLQVGDVLVAEMTVARPSEDRLANSGMLLVNPPHALEAELAEALPALQSAFSDGPASGFETSVYWLQRGHEGQSIDGPAGQ